MAEIDRFTDAIRQVADGGSVLDPEVVSHMLGRRGNGGPLERLTEREGEVLQLMAEGKTNRAISQQLYMSERAVERHVTAIFTKLDLPVTDQDHRRRARGPGLRQGRLERADRRGVAAGLQRTAAPGAPGLALQWHHRSARSPSTVGM